MAESIQPGECKMSIRTAVAQWLAPEIFRERRYLLEQVSYWTDRTEYWSTKALRRQDVLRAIASKRTPKANGTVRRICDIADAEINRSDEE